jgi:uncharacterized membrane protein YhhN
MAGLGCFLAGHVAWIIALRQRPGRGRLRAQPVLAAPHLPAHEGLVMATYTSAQALLACEAAA